MSVRAPGARRRRKGKIRLVVKLVVKKKEDWLAPLRCTRWVFVGCAEREVSRWGMFVAELGIMMPNPVRSVPTRWKCQVLGVYEMPKRARHPRSRGSVTTTNEYRRRASVADRVAPQES